MTRHCVCAEWFVPVLKYTEHKTTKLLTACFKVGEICSSWNQILSFSIIQSTSLSKQEFETFWVAVFKLAATFKPILWTHLCKIWFCWGLQLGSSDLEFVLSLEFVPVARPSETVQRSCVDSPGRGSSLGCRSSHCLCWRQNPQVSLGYSVEGSGLWCLYPQTKPLLTPFARLLDRTKELTL